MATPITRPPAGLVARARLEVVEALLSPGADAVLATLLGASSHLTPAAGAAAARERCPIWLGEIGLAEAREWLAPQLLVSLFYALAQSAPTREARFAWLDASAAAVPTFARGLRPNSLPEDAELPRGADDSMHLDAHPLIAGPDWETEADFVARARRHYRARAARLPATFVTRPELEQHARWFVARQAGATWTTIAAPAGVDWHRVRMAVRRFAALLGLPCR
jgi:hypothetical protein